MREAIRLVLSKLPSDHAWLVGFYHFLMIWYVYEEPGFAIFATAIHAVFLMKYPTYIIGRYIVDLPRPPKAPLHMITLISLLSIFLSVMVFPAGPEITLKNVGTYTALCSITVITGFVVFGVFACNQTSASNKLIIEDPTRTIINKAKTSLQLSCVLFIALSAALQLIGISIGPFTLAAYTLISITGIGLGLKERTRFHITAMHH